ncbi:MAG: undecaprenyldiphospho-muramoylpentapeptide beta-N-acetylglucosaminyltransferase [Candidatus Rokuibacteriota bacterium]|nr:MAG: undecaprenyldiphospho-muramoylpentapeptide beta-N-acetylglucosaminyltransferase [Candidatus Rokubacteria bacterium]
MTPRTSSAGGPAEALRRQTPTDVVIAGGGTGGHTSPGLAVATLLRQRSYSCVWIGSRSGIEAQRVPQSGIPYVAISTGKLRRHWTWQNVADLLVNVPAGAVGAVRALRALRPRVVFGTGGFVALPVVLGAALLRVPIVLHEQTSVPGLANRIGARFARRIAVTFPGSAGSFPTSRVTVTGNPLRPELRAGSRSSAIARFQLDPSLPLVYVTGGALGAQRINRVVGDALVPLLEHAQLIHQCGENPATGDRSWLEERRAALPPALARRYTIVPYVGAELAEIYAAAALVVARAGAGTVNECCQLGMPALYVPLPDTRGDEQTANARLVERAAGAVVLPQPMLTPERLVRGVQALLADPARLKQMGEQARTLAIPDAAERLVALLTESWRAA